MDHQSVWLADARIPPRPALAGDLDADVVVVGAGITGLTAALLAQRDGARVIVLEGGRVAAGSTGRSTGKVTSQHSMWAASMIERHGEDIARLYAQANQHAVELVGRLVGELGIDCHFARTFACAYTREPRTRPDIEREVEASMRLGLPARLVEELPLPFPIVAGVCFDEQVQLNPAMYAGGLARAVEAGGGQVFEHSRVTEVDEQGSTVTVRGVGGSVTASHAVVATLLPIVDIGGFFAKAHPMRSYGIALRLSEPPPEGMHITVDSPTRSTRPWRGAPDGNGLVVVGEGHKVGHGENLEQHYAELESWARQHFAVEEVAYRWSAQDYHSIDQLPFVGRCPRTERVWVGTGFKKWGLSNGTAAGVMLADLIAGREVAWLPAFDATRSGLSDSEAVKEAVKENAEVGKRFVADRLGRLRSEDVAALAPGEGGIVHVGDKAVAAFRAEDGTVHAVSPTCTHLGCTVKWNDAERSWDCPCHGSRFSVEGAVLDGPAVRPLDAYDVEP